MSGILITMSFEHFKSAQESDFDQALSELNRGRKTSHWIWYIFPQLAGLGASDMAQRYALQDIREAVEYLRDPLLRSRLLQVTNTVAQQLGRGTTLTTLMGGRLDAMKLVSSLTLFEIAAERLEAKASAVDLTELRARCGDVLALAERQGFPRCAFTARKAQSG